MPSLLPFFSISTESLSISRGDNPSGIFQNLVHAIWVCLPRCRRLPIWLTALSLHAYFKNRRVPWSRAKKSTFDSYPMSEQIPRTILLHLTCAVHVILPLNASRASLSLSVTLCHPSSSPSIIIAFLFWRSSVAQVHKSNGINRTGTPHIQAIYPAQATSSQSLGTLHLGPTISIPSCWSSLSSHCTALHACSHAHKLLYANTFAANRQGTAVTVVLLEQNVYDGVCNDAVEAEMGINDR